jgi:hypothetical protein
MATTDTATKSKPVAKKPAASARKPAARVKRATGATTARTATASSTRPATRTARAQQLAERAVLIPLGAALEARDRVTGTVAKLVAPYRSRSALESQLTRFERRGGKARTALEREVRRTRTRLERETRNARRGVQRRGPNVEGISDRVENVVQNGFNAGRKLVNGAQERIKSAA